MPVKSQFYEGPGASFNLDESETRDYFNSVRRSFFLSRLLLHLCFFVHDRKATLPFAMLTVQYHVSLSSPPRARSLCMHCAGAWNSRSVRLYTASWMHQATDDYPN